MKILRMDNQFVTDRLGKPHCILEIFWYYLLPGCPSWSNYLLMEVVSNYFQLQGSAVKNLPAHAGDVGGVPGSGRSPGDGNGNHSLPGKSRGQRSLAGYSPWGHKELDATVTKRQQSVNFTCWLSASISKFHFVLRSSIDSRNFHGEGIKVQAVILFACLAIQLEEIFIQSKYPSLHSPAQHRSQPLLVSTPCLLDICSPERPAILPQHWNNGKARMWILSSESQCVTILF